MKYIYIYENDLQLGKLKVNCLLLKLNRKLRKMFLSLRRESNPQPGNGFFLYATGNWDWDFTIFC